MFLSLRPSTALSLFQGFCLDTASLTLPRLVFQLQDQLTFSLFSENRNRKQLVGISDILEPEKC